MARPALRKTLACFLLLALGAIAGIDRARGAEPPNFDDHIRPLITRYCGDCHAGAQPEAGVAFDALPADVTAPPQRRLWERVRDYIGARMMPPAESPQPTATERETLLAWLSDVALKIDCSGPIDPGRVTIRRLNRTEYNNTIRDLVGIDFQPADDFPADDVGYGFDNIGDVLSLPPLLLEKYLTAAEQIVDRAIQIRQPDGGPTRRYEAEFEQATVGSRYGEGAFNLYSNGEVFVRHVFEEPGEYIVRIRAFGQQAGDEPCRMGLRIDDEQRAEFEVAAVERDPQVYEQRLTIEAGAHRVAAAFLNDYYRPQARDPNQRDRNLVIDYIEVAGPLTGPPEPPESHRRIVLCHPDDDGADERECARKILRKFASWAYRRPATAEEVERLVALGGQAREAGASFEEALKLPLTAVLVSPYFLFRVELDHPADRPDGSYPINDFELASRLSYFLWSSMPDDELFHLAFQQKLRDPAVLDEQVRRMLRDPKSQALVENFAGQWLQLRNLDRLAPDPGLFPGFDEPLRQAMRRETEMLFAAVKDEDRGVLDFLDADFTFVNERLARHYGLEGVTGDEFRRVDQPDDRRGGVLTHASVLTLTSNPTRTSPVKRGKWVLETLLGTPPPPPPPGAGDLPEEQAGQLTGTLREKMEQHRQKANCASCHARMDPLGFGLENFDAIGAWRDREGEFEIDSSGELPGGESFRGPAELRKILAGKRDLFIRCLSEKMLTYALGRGLEYYDACTINTITAHLSASDYRFSELILAVVGSEPFQRRRGPGEKP
jgi:hypothetical protein